MELESITVRGARYEDCEDVFRMLKEFAVLEKFADKFTGDIDTFRRDGFSDDKRFDCIVAEDKSGSGTAKINGFLLYTWLYNTRLGGRVMYIEDFYVSENSRRHGVGTMLFEMATETAITRGFRRVQGIQRIENEAMSKFSQKRGVMDATKDLGWNIVRLLEDIIQAKAEKLNKWIAMGPVALRKWQSDNNTDVIIRESSVEDCEDILGLMKEMAIYGEEVGKFSLDIHAFRRDGFGIDRHFYCFVAEERPKAVAVDKPRMIGFLLYTLMYKAWQGSYIMYIDEIFVTEKNRRKGVGTALFEQAIKTAAMKGSRRIRMTVPKHNASAMTFFKNFGAVNATEESGLHFIIFETRQPAGINCHL